MVRAATLFNDPDLNEENGARAALPALPFWRTGFSLSGSRLALVYSVRH